jgi:DNA-nicking Smr family endonuclease
MAKKRPKKPEDGIKITPFAGFHPLAEGLRDRKVAVPAVEAKKPPPPRPRAAEPTIDDHVSFQRMMAGVTPLKDSPTGRVPVVGISSEAGARERKANEVRTRAAADAEQALDRLRTLVEGSTRFEVSDDGRRVEGRRADTQPALLRSLRRGGIAIDAQLDLHGMNAATAEEAVVTFLRTTRARQERCVLIIHGKGERHAGAGVLRGEMAAWLSQGKAREHVAAFATACDEDGGEGAIYVALRR